MCLRGGLCPGGSVWRGSLSRGVCILLSTRRCAYFCLLGGVPTTGVCVWGVCVQAGSLWGVLSFGGVSIQGSAWMETPTPLVATAAVGMHPTGMHSCSYLMYDELHVLSLLTALRGNGHA